MLRGSEAQMLGKCEKMRTKFEIRNKKENFQILKKY